ncbi:RE1-silencing transcription factor-like isoform X2 [Cydia strobilella]|uniref:RE1-silencing transcription factor-like isoform X2 n=1 Tax=Cydia strobilella TaxID=1100964 RepID=UPI0030054B50
MEKRKESLSDKKLCRFCLTQDSSLTSLYDRSRDPILVTLPLKIMACVSIEVFPSDKMPSYICERCRVFMDICYDFKQICRRADESCLQFVQNGVPISSVNWPSPLMKIFQLTKRTASRTINTVVEGGATIAVTSQDMFENDNEDEETFNIKINASRDGSERIKVTPSGDKESASVKKAGFTSVSKLSRHVRAHAGDRAYPCKYCNKSFVKSHHYTRHLRLKHEELVRQALGRGDDAEFRCKQCTESFRTQDELYYHSAIHATQNLTCPLCQEKFENVDAVTTHIRTHVNGIEFMCDYCELVFTSKEKLDAHMSAAHDDEAWPGKEMDESSLEADAMDADVDDDDDDNGLNVKEEGDHMVVEIKKADGYMLKKKIEVGQIITTNSSGSGVSVYTDSDAVEGAEAPREPAWRPPPATKSEATSSRLPAADEKISILRKAEAMKRKAGVKEESVVPQKKERAAKVDSTTNNAGSSDKSLRILEKELQELKRTTTRVEGKPTKAGEVKSKRQPVHTSTPKLRSGDDKKAQATPKLTTSVEKKPAERRILNKEPKEAVAKNAVTSSKDEKNVSSTKDDKTVGDRDEPAKDNSDKKTSREDENPPEKTKVTDKNIAQKEDKGASKEAKGKVTKEDVPSSSKNEASSSTKTEKSAPAKSEDKTVKNGDTSGSEDSSVRRSTRPSKIKNYASMIRDRTRIIRDADDDEEVSDMEEEFVGPEPDSQESPARKSLPKRQKSATPAPATAPASSAAAAASTPAATPVARRRGRPRKDATPKESCEDAEVDPPTVKEPEKKPEEPTKEPEVTNNEIPTEPQTTPVQATTPPASAEPQANTLMSPTGQPLKKVPVKALPPGVKPLPLPLNARRDLCQMQIGKKMVKVQKIVMTKAEVEAMAKKGLLELKDGTMVLKQGIKLPGGEPAVLRSGLVSQGAIRKVSATPTRCNFEADEG